MPQFLFKVLEVETMDDESKDPRLINKVANVEAEVIDKASGNTICKGTFPVTYNSDTVYPSVKAINAIDAPKYIKKEILFRSKRYIKRLRRWL